MRKFEIDYYSLAPISAAIRPPLEATETVIRRPVKKKKTGRQPMGLLPTPANESQAPLLPGQPCTQAGSVPAKRTLLPTPRIPRAPLNRSETVRSPSVPRNDLGGLIARVHDMYATADGRSEDPTSAQERNPPDPPISSTSFVESQEHKSTCDTATAEDISREIPDLVAVKTEFHVRDISDYEGIPKRFLYCHLCIKHLRDGQVT